MRINALGIIVFFTLIFSLQTNASLTKHRPLVRVTSNNFHIYHYKDAKIHPTLLKTIEYNYMLGKEKKIKLNIVRDHFNKQGWEITDVVGMSGIPCDEKADIPLTIFFNQDKNIIIISYRGTQSSLSDLKEGRKPFSIFGKSSTDWRANYDVRGSTTVELIEYLESEKSKVRSLIMQYGQTPSYSKQYQNLNDGVASTKYFQKTYPGTKHLKFYRGYLYELVKTQKDFNQKLISVLSKIENDNLKSLRVYITGHSQGGGQAVLTSPFATITINKFIENKLELASRIDNTELNYIKVHALSSPRVFQGNTTLRWAENLVGKHNVARQNVVKSNFISIGDIVPSVGLGDYVAKMLDFSILGRSLSKKYASFKDMGYLAGDYFKDVVKRNLTNSNAIYNSISNERGDHRWFFGKIKSSFKWLVNKVASAHYGTMWRRVDEEPDKYLFCLKCADVQNSIDESTLYGEHPIIISNKSKYKGSQCNKNFKLTTNIDMNSESYKTMKSFSNYSEIEPNVQINFFHNKIKLNYKNDFDSMTLSRLLNQGYEYKNRLL